MLCEVHYVLKLYGVHELSIHVKMWRGRALKELGDSEHPLLHYRPFSDPRVKCTNHVTVKSVDVELAVPVRIHYILKNVKSNLLTQIPTRPLELLWSVLQMK